MPRQRGRRGDPVPRFFVDPDQVRGGSVLLTGQTAQHIAVLRLRPGDPVTLCTGDGFDHACTLDSVGGGQAVLTVNQTMPNATEPRVQVTIFMAYAKADKLEHVIQKATELGAAAIVAFPSARCVSRPDGKALPKKLERWQAIARSAAEQSGRGVIPPVTTAPSCQSALEQAAAKDLALFFYENEQQTHLSGLFEGRCPRTISILTGPEGGFSPEEALQAQAAGLRSCSLGPRILRCETAPLCALAAVMYAAGEL